MSVAPKSEGVKRIRLVAVFAGMIAAIITLCAALANASSQPDGKQFIGDVSIAVFFGIVTWGLVSVVAWIAAGFSKKSIP
jgi:multisubunit Na+/H+ antiporter MnhB subunit